MTKEDYAKQEIIAFRKWFIEFDRGLSFAEDINWFHNEASTEMLYDMYIKEVSPLGYRKYLESLKH